MNLVTLRDVGVAYDGYEALQHVDLEIADNDFLGVIGPNGGGKTTLVKAILGTVPHTGEVRLAPELCRDKERLIGYMPQLSDFDRTFPISVLEVVLSGLQGHKGIFSRYTKADRAKALDLLETAGVADTARNPIGEVSGGQMQRALLCRAVISDPKLLILDEPLNGLDPSGVLDFRMLVRSLAADGTSVLISSHQLAEMELMCSRLIIIESGFIVSIKTLKELTGESDDIPVHYRLDVNDAARALKLLTDNGFSAETAESGLNVYMTRLQSAEAARLLVENNIAVYGLTAVKKTLSDAFLEATGKRRRAKKK